MQPWRPRIYEQQVNIRMSRPVLQWLQGKAEAERLSVSGYIRKVVEQAALQELRSEIGTHEA